MRKYVESGTVYLVGAGPGDPDLLTVRGLRLLRIADTVVYDRLVHPDLLLEARSDAEHVFVGKASGRHSYSQGEINRLLVERARAGKVVVRLKGGDPFVFGRGGEECLALASSGIPFQVVPGISSAIGVPAYAGIPVTHRNVSSAFTVVTGHSCRDGDDPDWISLARAGTLIILMGLRRLPQIARILIDAGMNPSTPAAVIASGATDEQVVIDGTLKSIGLRSRHLVSPATIVIGDVVSLRCWTSWFHPHDHIRAGGDGAIYGWADGVPAQIPSKDGLLHFAPPVNSHGADSGRYDESEEPLILSTAG